MSCRNVSQVRNLSSFLLAVTIGTASVSCSAEQQDVKIEGKPGSFQLIRNGKPYFIKGVGGLGSRQLLIKCGGNSIRTWGADGAQEALDAAEKDGLSVSLGIWLGHSDVFNYHNPTEVQKQFEMCKQVVEKFKNHKALLVWALGNEMEGNGEDPAVWKAINDIAVMCKKLDPNHPTMTVVAEIGGAKLQNFEKHCPDVDILGINSYGGAPSLAERYQKAGGTKPYILTEFGPPGPWEVAKTKWDAPIEMSSTAKADYVKKGYEAAVKSQQGTCLGSYAFLWGNKQEGTATWFGMLLPNGTRLGSVDVVSEFWKGEPPKNPVPKIKSLTLDSTENLKPGQEITAHLESDAGANHKVEWVVVAEGSERFTAGRDEPVPESYPGAITEHSQTSAKIKVPTSGGGYRIFAYIFDQAGGAAVANVPFFVDAPVAKIESEKPSLPFAVYSEEGSPMPFSPTGWMGNTGELKLVLNSTSKPHSGATCAEVTFTGHSSWAGVAWQYPANDWGDKPKAFDLTGAKSLSLWMRGDKGGEKVNIEFGIIKGNKKYSDSGTAKLVCTLTNDWKQYKIDLTGIDLSRIKTGFVFTVEGTAEPIKFYFDNVQYE